jgi:2-C-methyl-D-erythritol 4-phosphate cytidylyltransferase
MRCSVILPAAGVGKRFQAPVSGDAFANQLMEQPKGVSKVELDLAGKPAFLRAIELFIQRPKQIGQIILAVNPDVIDAFKFRWSDKLAFHHVKLIAGGKTERWETVANALEVVDEDATHIAVHDAARPLATSKLIDRLLEAALQFDAVVPGLAVADTLKRVQAEPSVAGDVDPLDDLFGDEGKLDTTARQVVDAVSRENVVAIQTPQVFSEALLRKAYQQIADGVLDPANITDDAGLVEALGQPVQVIDGEVTNLKITRAEDAEFAAAVVQSRDRKDSSRMAKKRLFGDDD